MQIFWQFLWNSTYEAEQNLAAMLQWSRNVKRIPSLKQKYSHFEWGQKGMEEKRGEENEPEKGKKKKVSYPYAYTMHATQYIITKEVVNHHLYHRYHTKGGGKKTSIWIFWSTNY